MNRREMLTGIAATVAASQLPPMPVESIEFIKILPIKALGVPMMPSDLVAGSVQEMTITLIWDGTNGPYRDMHNGR